MLSAVRNTLFGLCLVILVAAPAQAVLIHLAADLDGAQEVPQVNNPLAGGTQADVGGSGSAALTFDTATHILSWTISYSLNTGNASAAHFHGPTLDADPAGPGLASPVRITIPDIAGTSSGTVMGSFDLDDLVNAADNPAKLLSGLWYINIHTPGPPSDPTQPGFSGGEIRGQVQVIPEPGTFALLTLGLVGLGIVHRWRSRPDRL